MSRALHNFVPAGSLEAKDLQHLLHPVTNLKVLHEQGPTISMKAKGVYLWDSKGKQYLEGMAGLWCTALGYGEEELARTAREQMEILCYSQLFGSRSNEPSILLAEKLKSMMPMDAGRVFFGLSGSDANDTQVKLMRYYHNVAGAERLPAPGGRAVPALRRRQRVTMGEFAFLPGRSVRCRRVLPDRIVVGSEARKERRPSFHRHRGGGSRNAPAAGTLHKRHVWPPAEIPTLAHPRAGSSTIDLSE